MRAEAEGERECGDEGAGVGEEIAVRGVEGEVVLVGEADADAGADVARCGGGDATVGIDGCGDSGVGGTQNPAVIFDGAHADHVEVLPGGAGVAVPAVVGDVDQDFGSLLGELADLVAEDGLVADEGSVGVAAGGEDGALLAGIEEAYFVEEALCEEEEVLVGDVLAEGDEMHLVVAANEARPAAMTKEAELNRMYPRSFVGGAVDADVADDDRSVGSAGERATALRGTAGRVSSKGAGDSGQTMRSVGDGAGCSGLGSFDGGCCRMRKTDCVPGSSGIPRRKWLEGIATEVGEGFEELLCRGLGAGVGGADLEIFLNESRVWLVVR